MKKLSSSLLLLLSLNLSANTQIMGQNFSDEFLEPVCKNLADRIINENKAKNEETQKEIRKYQRLSDSIIRWNNKIRSIIKDNPEVSAESRKYIENRNKLSEIKQSKNKIFFSQLEEQVVTELNHSVKNLESKFRALVSKYELGSSYSALNSSAYRIDFNLPLFFPNDLASVLINSINSITQTNKISIWDTIKVDDKQYLNLEVNESGDITLVNTPNATMAKPDLQYQLERFYKGELKVNEITDIELLYKDLDRQCFKFFPKLQKPKYSLFTEDSRIIGPLESFESQRWDEEKENGFINILNSEFDTNITHE